MPPGSWQLTRLLAQGGEAGILIGTLCRSRPFRGGSCPIRGCRCPSAGTPEPPSLPAHGRISDVRSISRLGLGWVEHSEFRVPVPKKRKVDFFLYVADVDDPKNADMRPFECRVRPR